MPPQSPPRRHRGLRRAGEEGAAAAHAPDRLSALPDALLHRVLSSVKAWEVVRTCVLSRRWRHLWASAPCVDLRLRVDGGDDDAPEEFPRFVRRLFRHRDASATVDTLRLRSSDADGGAYDEDDAKSWIRAAIKRNARVVHLIGHRKGLAVLEHAAFVSAHLKVLKLSYAMLDGDVLKQLSSRCPSLEEMDLKDCLFAGNEISSASLKMLTMVKCTFNLDFSVAALNLVVLRCIKPMVRAPSFKNLGSLVTGIIILDDNCFSDDFEDFSEDEFDETTDDDESDHSRDDKVGYGNNRKHKMKAMSDDDGWNEDTDDESDGDTDDESDGDADDESDEISGVDSDDGKKRKLKAGAGFGFGLPQKRHRPGVCKDVNNYGVDTESDDNTFEYSDIANDCDVSSYDGVGQSSGKDGSCWVYGQNSGSNDKKVLGGQNVLHCLLNTTSLELLADAGEVILTRELKSCPSCSNLKTLSLGEWCVGADFDALVFFLQHSPNLERLFLELMNSNIRKSLETGVKPKGRSFACKRLQMVKIKCSKDDVRVHKLAHLFRANGVPVEKIFVRRTGSTYLRGKKMMKDFARHELQFWGED